MARYQALEVSFHNNSLVQPGDVVNFDDTTVPGPNWAKVDEEDEPEATKPARKSKKAAAEESGSDLA